MYKCEILGVPYIFTLNFMKQFKLFLLINKKLYVKVKRYEFIPKESTVVIC